jgi:SulP family sulfate permease
MSRVDAAAFLATAVSVGVNAVLAVAIGCSIYGLKLAYVRWVRPESRVPDLQVD